MELSDAEELMLATSFIDKYKVALMEVALISMDVTDDDMRFHIQQRVRKAIGESSWLGEVWPNRKGSEPPEAGVLLKCLVCAREKPWGVYDNKTGVAVWGYNVNKSNSFRGEQSSSESCAKHLKARMEGRD